MSDSVTPRPPLFMGLSRQEYWSGLPSPSPGDLPHLGVAPVSLASLALTGEFFTPEPSGSPVVSSAKVLQSCPTLCDPVDGSPPGSPVHGIFQAGVLEWAAVDFSGS